MLLVYCKNWREFSGSRRINTTRNQSILNKIRGETKLTRIEIKFDCPICKKFVSVEIESSKIDDSIRYPVPIIVTHGTPEHAVTAFIDREYRVRATNAVNIVQRLEESETQDQTYVKRHVPFPRNERIALEELDSNQIAIVALVDGRKSVAELASILDLTEMRVKIICQQLVRMGKLDSVRVVIGKK